jgi:exonuclease SbcD
LLQDASANSAKYAERVAAIIAKLSEAFTDDAVNIVAAHGFVRGGRLGGGERDAQTIEDYWVDATAFGARPHYVALGHLHLTQQIAGGCPIWYSGSPIQVDFGEEGDDKHVLVVDAQPGVPVSTPRRVKLETPRRLATLRGTLQDLAISAATVGDDFLRVFVQEKARAGLADEVRELLPNAVDVFIERTGASQEAATQRHALARSPHELFSSYLAEQDVADERVEQLFAKLLDDETSVTELAV